MKTIDQHQSKSDDSQDFKITDNMKLLNCPWIDKDVFENLE